MRWFWRRKELREAVEAKERAEQRRPEVERLVHDLRARRAANHFAPMFAEAIRGRHH